MYKRNSKILAALLTIVLVFSIFPSLRVNAAASGTCGAQGDNLIWTLDDAGVLTISGTGAMADYEIPFYTPWYYDMSNVTSIVISDGVTSIGDSSFYGCNNASSVQIGSTVETIGEESFRGCTSINSITLPESVQSIASAAFMECTGLESINIPAGVSKIEGSTFNSCSNLKSITIPDSVTTIDVAAFSDCTSLKSITIPDGVTTIGLYAFENCTSLESVEIPANVTSYDYYAFYGCNNLKNVTIADGSTIIGDGEFYGCTSLESITIPDSVSSIGDAAFVNCTSLTSITIPNSVTTIGNSTFIGCTSLTGITIPDSVQDIDFYAFKRCTSLTDVAMSKDLYDNLVQKGTLNDVFYGITLPSIHFSYTVDYKSNGNGTITGTTKSFGTDQIVLTVQPDNYYVLDKIEWSDGTNSGVLTESNGKYTMPDTEAGAVTLTATFKLDQKTVTFKNDDGTVLQSGIVDCGTTPAYTDSTPAKAEDDQYTYTFAGWSDGTKTYGPTDTLPAVTDDATYTAVFDSTVKQYTIKFIDEDGSVLQSGDFDFGSTPAYTGTTPTKAEDDDYTYTFSGWTPAITTVTADATYTATFTKTAKPTPQTTPATTPTTVTKPGTYYLSSMEEQDGKLVITIKMNEDDSKTFDLLGSISSDGVLLTEGNQYARAKGSLIITLQKSYLDTLAAGNHKLTVTFTDGGSITIDYVVKAPATASVPATGEAISTASILGCIILATAGIAFTIARKRKEEV